MACFIPFLLFSVFSSFVSFSKAQEFEISPQVLLAGSPAAMLFTFLETQDDLSGAEQMLAVLPSVCKTQGLDRGLEGDALNAVDCDLSGVDPECFLINLAGQVGRSWGTELADEDRAAVLIDKLLKERGLTLQAAAAACAAAPLVVPLLSQFGTQLASPAEVIAEAATACKL